MRACLLLPFMLGAGCAWAAGGHHGVDDAAILEPGRCELQAWVTREAGGGARLLHVEPACRVGPVEIAVGGEAQRGAGGTAASLQAKFARPVSDRWHLGGSLTLQRSDDPSARRVATGLLLATWSLEPLSVHLNAGRQATQRAGAGGRWGIGADWRMASDWTGTAEAWREPQGGFARLGLRHQLREDWSIDVSRLRARHAHAPPSWTVGATWEFGRL